MALALILEAQLSAEKARPNSTPTEEALGLPFYQRPKPDQMFYFTGANLPVKSPTRVPFHQVVVTTVRGRRIAHNAIDIDLLQDINRFISVNGKRAVQQRWYLQCLLLCSDITQFIRFSLIIDGIQVDSISSNAMNLYYAIVYAASAPVRDLNRDVLPFWFCRQMSSDGDGIDIRQIVSTSMSLELSSDQYRQEEFPDSLLSRGLVAVYYAEAVNNNEDKPVIRTKDSVMYERFVERSMTISTRLLSKGSTIVFNLADVHLPVKQIIWSLDDASADIYVGDQPEITGITSQSYSFAVEPRWIRPTGIAPLHNRGDTLDAASNFSIRFTMLKEYFWYEDLRKQERIHKDITITVLLICYDWLLLGKETDKRTNASSYRGVVNTWSDQHRGEYLQCHGRHLVQK